jgi:hypothetical protein
MSYSNTISAFPVRISLPLIHHKAEDLIFRRALILVGDIEEIGQLYQPCLLALYDHIMHSKKINSHIKPPRILLSRKLFLLSQPLFNRLRCLIALYALNQLLF